jgi:cytochrome c
MLWIRDPQKVDSGTSMPNLNVSEADARDISAYLYTLRK